MLPALFLINFIFTKDVGDGDDLWYSPWHSDRSATEDDQFIGLENGVALFIEDYELVSIFLEDLSALPADPCILAV